jgi:RNA polymerase sigma factor (sigma-70 family)
VSRLRLRPLTGLIPQQRQPTLDQARHDLIESRRKLALAIGNEYCNSRGLDPDARSEVLADALVGLVRGIDGFNPDVGVKLNTYLGIRIRGAILDGARSRYHLKRGDRPSEDVVPLQRATSLDAFTAAGGDVTDSSDPYADVDDRDEQQQLMAAAEDVMARYLSPVQQTVVRGHLLDGRALTDLARQIGVSHTTCQKTLKNALTLMRWHMKDTRE